jgi:predicted CXXCH cytochrome family protein
LSARCGVCHSDSACQTAAALGDQGRTGCVNCHMPVVPSKLIEVQTYRTHRIAVYRK